jgi:hypothetical protein
MKDWRAIAQAGGLKIDPKELDGIAQPLDALEQAFRPLVKDLAPDLEPAVEFRMEEGAG